MLQQPVVPAHRAPRETRPWRMFPGRAASGAAALCMAGLVGAEGNVVATSVVSAAGETIVRVETTLRQPPEAVWPSFATEAGAALLGRAGGAPRFADRLSTAVAPRREGGDRRHGTITLPIVNYVDAEFITFRVVLSEAFAANLRAEGDRLQEVIRLQRLADGGTRIVSTMLGWGSGPEWAKTAAFFVKGNEWAYGKLARCVDGPAA